MTIRYGTVSTIIPVYNRAGMIRSAVQSVLDQTYRPIEIILVDDGSTDHTFAELQQLANEHPEIIRAAHRENGGPGLARETGRLLATGEFIQYLDSDDLLLPRKFKVQVAALQANPECGIAYGRSSVIDQNGQTLQELSKWTGMKFDFLFPALLVDRWWNTHTPLYRRSLCDQIGPWPAQRPEDWDYDARAGATGARLVFCDELLSCQRQHEGSCVTKWSYESYLPQEAWFLPRLFDCAEKAGVPFASPEMRHFSRWAFSLSRRMAVRGKSEVAAELLGLAHRANGRDSVAMKAYRWTAQLLGWRFSAQLLEDVRKIFIPPSRAGDDTLVPSYASACRSVVIVAPDCRRGGSVGAVAWRHAVELSRWYTVHVVSRDTPDAPNERVIPHRIFVRSWNRLRRFSHVPNELAFASAVRSELLRLTREESIGVVWCHGHVPTALAAVPLRKSCGFGVAMTTHGDIFNRPKGTYDPLLTRLYQYCTPKAYRGADKVQALSPYMADSARRGGAKESAVTVVPNGIDPAELGLEDWPESRSSEPGMRPVLRLLFVGVLIPLKGVSILLEALSHLRKEHPALEWRLKIVGGGPEETRLKALSEEMNLSDRVTFAGRCAREKLAAYYLSSDLLCVPSLDDPLPTVVLEGLACGLPIVGSQVGGIPFMVEEGRTGFLAEPGDPIDLARCILAAATSPSGLAQMSQHCMEVARVRYDWSQIGERLYCIAEECFSQVQKGIL